MSASARPVRISRRENPSSGSGASDGTPSGTGIRFRANTAGLTRAGRLFGIFLAALTACYAIFLGMLLTGPNRDAVGSGTILGFLSAAAALLAIGAFALTLARTPRGLELKEGSFLVTEFLGARRSFPTGELLRLRVENDYPAGLLAPEPTQMVALKAPAGPTRHYLVGEDFLP